MEPTHRAVWPVVIVGAGPAGLAAAIALAGSGVECCVVDRHPGPAPHPRATALSLRSMELLRQWGLEAAVTAGGVDVELQMRIVTTLADVAHGTTVDVGFPTQAQSRAISPTAPACVPQDHLESVLRAHLARLPAAHLDRCTRLAGLRVDDGAHVLSLRDEATGATHRVRAQYVIGADGVRSTVRELLGIDVHATPTLFDGTSVLFHAPLWPVVGEHRYGLYAIEDPVGAGILLPAGRDDRWVYAYERDEPAAVERGDRSPTATTADRIRAAVGGDLPHLEVTSRQVVSFVGAIAERFRADDAFLVGDAAHRVTPRGGTGLNTALADGFDLGWKLAWVLRGWAPSSMLDSYEAERRPVAEHQLARSIQPDGSRRDTDRAVTVDIGGRIRHAWLPGTPRRSTLDLVGAGLTVLRHGPRRASAPPTSPLAAPIDEHELDPITARALGIPPGGHLVVRPDGVPVATSGADPTPTDQHGGLGCPTPA